MRPPVMKMMMRLTLRMRGRGVVVVGVVSSHLSIVQMDWWTLKT